MNTTVVTLGLVLLAAAAIGGGLTAAAVRVPLISTVTRQVLLACVGLTAVVLGLVSTTGGSAGPEADQSTPVSSGSPTAAPTRTPTATHSASGGADQGGAGGGSSDGGFIAEYRHVTFTTPAPQGACDDEVGVTFTQEGPQVATDVDSANVGNFTLADLFYDNCNSQNSYLLVIPNEDPFTEVHGEPGPAECARRATQQPIGRTFPFAALRAGMQFCLLDTFNNQLAYVALTRVSANHDLAWTASGWQAPQS